MNKQNLINRAERWEEQSRKMPLMDYPRDGQEEMMKISSAIIKTLCEMENKSQSRESSSEITVKVRSWARFSLSDMLSTSFR